MRVFIFTALVAANIAAAQSHFTEVLNLFVQRLEDNVDDVALWPNFCLTKISTQNISPSGKLQGGPMELVAQSHQHNDTECDNVDNKKTRLRELQLRYQEGKIEAVRSERCVAPEQLLPCYKRRTIRRDFTIAQAVDALTDKGYHWIKDIEHVRILPPAKGEEALRVEIKFFGWYHYTIPRRTWAALNMETLEVLSH